MLLIHWETYEKQYICVVWFIRIKRVLKKFLLCLLCEMNDFNDTLSTVAVTGFQLLPDSNDLASRTKYVIFFKCLVIYLLFNFLLLNCLYVLLFIGLNR